MKQELLAKDLLCKDLLEILLYMMGQILPMHKHNVQRENSYVSNPFTERWDPHSIVTFDLTNTVKEATVVNMTV